MSPATKTSMPVRQLIDDYLSILGDAPCDCPAEEMIIFGHAIYRSYSQQHARWMDEIERDERVYALEDGERWYQCFLNWSQATEKWLERAEGIDNCCLSQEIVADIEQLRQEWEAMRDTLVPPREMQAWAEYIVEKFRDAPPGNITLYDALHSD